MTKHKTGTREEWLTERLELLKEEKELTRRSDDLACCGSAPSFAACSPVASRPCRDLASPSSAQSAAAEDRALQAQHRSPHPRAGAGFAPWRRNVRHNGRVCTC